MNVNQLIEKLQAMPEEDRELPVWNYDPDIEFYDVEDGPGIVARIKGGGVVTKGVFIT